MSRRRKTRIANEAETKGRRWGRRLVFLLALGVGIFAGDRAFEPLAARLDPEWLRIDRVSIQGRDRIPELELLAHLGIAAGTPLLRIDEAELERRVETHPWIAKATVTSLRPGTLLVSIDERVPHAVTWLGEPPIRYLVDGRGTPFQPVNEEGSAGLILVLGPKDAEPEVPNALLSEGVALAAWVDRRIPGRIAQVLVQGASPDRLPSLVLRDGGARVLLGAGDRDRKLARLRALLEADLRSVAQAVEIDLRFGDRMVLRSVPSPGGDVVASSGGRPRSQEPGPTG